jgi:hypothetical protein
VNFVLIGDPMNPNGGMFARFPGLTFPSIGGTFYGGTPANDYPTVIYTGEYDGYADFPRYPIDFLSDLNALLGVIPVHGGYPTFTAAQVMSATQLPTSGSTMTTYYMIPTQHLPLLDPVRLIPYIGNPVADLLQPDLTYLVNWGYGDPAYGYSTGPANVNTPFGFLPPLGNHCAGARSGQRHPAGNRRCRQRLPHRGTRLAAQPLAVGHIARVYVSSIHGAQYAGPAHHGIRDIHDRRHYLEPGGGEHQHRRRLDECHLDGLRDAASDGRYRHRRPNHSPVL